MRLHRSLQFALVAYGNFVFATFLKLQNCDFA